MRRRRSRSTAPPKEITRGFGIGSFVIVPLVSDGRCLGFLTCDERGEAFSLDAAEVDLLTTFGTLIAAFLERAIEHGELRRLNELKSQFAALASHELRTPVAAIYGAVRTLDEREFSGESSYDSRFVQSGVGFFVSSGDAGLPAEYPSASPNVISVGGTTLHFSGANFTSETGWSSGGGGCSSYETATSAQSAFSGYGQVGCAGKRATPDVSLDADPASGVSVYDSTRYQGRQGWFTSGGTRASSRV